MSPAVQDQIGTLVKTVIALARERSGSLAAIEVTAPTGISLEQFVEELGRRLASAGLGAVEIAARPSEGPARVLLAEFDR